MRKLIVSLFIIMILCTYMCQVFASTDTYKMELTIKNNSKNINVDIYILLPQEYIEFAINESPVWIRDYVTYKGASTLKTDAIEGIEVNKQNVQDDTYVEDGVEYVQIRLDKNLNGIYVFDVLSDYGKMNIKYRIKNEDKDYIMHIDNFKIEEEVCKIEYDYDEDIIKQPDTKKISVSTIILIVILILVILVGLISYVKGKE